MFAYSDLTISELAQKIKRLTLETSWVDIGRILKIIGNRKRERYRKVLTEIALSDRTASYLMAIVYRLDSQGIKVPQGIGWRKMAEVAPVITYENQAAIFEKVRQHTRDELIEMRQAGTLA